MRNSIKFSDLSLVLILITGVMVLYEATRPRSAQEDEQFASSPHGSAALDKGRDFSRLSTDGNKQGKRPPKPGPPRLGIKKSLQRLPIGPSSIVHARPFPEIGPNIRVNDPQLPYPDGLLGRSETAIAATFNARHIVAGWNDVEGFLRPPFGDTLPGPPGLTGFGFSTDGGETWIDGGSPPLFDHLLTAGDPWLDRGGADENSFYFSNLTVDDRHPFDSTFPLGISIHRGHFRNNGFAWEDVRLIQSPNYPRDIYDKGVLAAAKDGSSDVYLALTNFKGICGGNDFGFGQIELWRSRDSGETWQGPVVVSPDETFITDPANPDCGTEGLRKHNPMPVAGIHGEVYVTWSQGPTYTRDGVSTDAEIMVARSIDGGATFSPPVRIADINSVTGNPPVGYDRSLLDDISQIAVARTGAHQGRVFSCFYSAAAPVPFSPTEQSLVSTQIFLSYSDDQGRTWTMPTVPVADVPATGVKQFWPAISVTANGEVNLVYYRSEERQATADPNDIECDVLLGDGEGERIGKVSSLVDTMWVHSEDGGVSFKAPLKVSTATSNWCTVSSNIFPTFGDYIGSISGSNHVLAVWTDSRNGVPDVYFSNIFAPGKNP